MNKIIFVNGIKTTEKEGRVLSNLLADILGYSVHLFYNPTQNVFADAWEAFRARWFYKVTSTAITQQLADLIEESLADTLFDRIILIGHSQGTVIIANAIRLIRKEDRIRLRCTLFAPVNTQEPPGGQVEYFLNDADLVVKMLPGRWIRKGWLGVKSIFTSTRKRGHVFTRAGFGHSLAEDYLAKRNDFRDYTNSYFSFLERL